MGPSKIPKPLGTKMKIPDLASELNDLSLKEINLQVPYFMMGSPQRNKMFYGREEILEQLDRALLPNPDQGEKHRCRPVILHGMGGIGKSEIALEFVYSRRNQLDAVFWIRADNSASSDADIAQIAIQLGINDPKNSDNQFSNRKRALSWLCNPFKISKDSGRQTASWLVVFDNADDLHILNSYRDIFRTGAVLITTRSPYGKKILPISTVSVEIPRLNPVSSGEFIQSLTGITSQDREARAVGQRLGGLPLALVQMAGIIKHGSLTYTEFLKRYADLDEAARFHSKVVPGQTIGSLGVTARGSLSTIWGLDELGSHCRELLEILSFLRPYSISTQIVERGEAALDGIPYLLQLPDEQHKRVYWPTREELLENSLLLQQNCSYRIERVVQDVVRARIQPTRRHSVFSSAVSLVLDVWPTRIDRDGDSSFWGEAELLLPHVLSLYEAYKTYFGYSSHDDDHKFAKLLVYSSWYEYERGQSYKVLLPRLELALKLCTRTSSRDNRDIESDVRFTLATVAGEFNDEVTCMKHSKELLRLRLEITKGTDTADDRLSRAYYQMGIAWMMQRQYERAEESIEMLVKKYMHVSDADKVQLSLAIANLALVYFFQGQLELASEIIEKGIKDRQAYYGYMDTHCFRTGFLLYILGKVRFAQGQFQESLDCYQRAVWQYESTLGSLHRRTADACFKMAQVQVELGGDQDPLPLIDKGLEAWSHDPETYGPEIARMSFLKARALRTFQPSRKNEAKRLYEAAALYQRKILGVNTTELKDEGFDEWVSLWSR